MSQIVNYFHFFSFSSVYDGRCETIVTKKNERKKSAVILILNLANILRCEKIDLE